MNLVLNMNGDTAETLVDNLLDAGEAYDTLLRAMRRMTPHGRNYPNGGYQRAQAQHHIALEHLECIKAHLDRCVEELMAAQAKTVEQVA